MHDKAVARQDSPVTPYLRFGVMIGTSTVVMYALTYANVFSLGHVHWSLERAYMAVLMGSAMSVVMMAFMWGRMYPNTRVNIAVVTGAVLLGVAALLASQFQVLVGDQSYMRAMIPHHSIAILTSERADLQDVRVRELADGISRTQVQEIQEMEWLLQDIALHGKAATAEQARLRPVPTFSGDISQATCLMLPWQPHGTRCGQLQQ